MTVPEADLTKRKPKRSGMKVFLNGIFRENPTFVLVLGTCPTLAVTVSAYNGLGMGLATTFVLACSNLAISLLRKIVPDKVRIPIYVTVIAAFVSIVQMIMTAWLPELNEALGVYIPLIVVNCIILARAEAFASKNNAWHSTMDGLGMGIGFTLALIIMGSIRELIGLGTVFGLSVFGAAYPQAIFFVLPAGGFLTFGFLIGAFNAIMTINTRRTNRLERERRSAAASGCSACPAKLICESAQNGDGIAPEKEAIGEGRSE